jgi:ribosome modulation factor
MTFVSRLPRLIALTLVVWLSGCQGARPPSMVPLPRIEAGTVQMRVAYLVNDRLPRMDPAQLAALLEAARAAAREHLGVQIHFSEPVEVPIERAFAGIPSARRDSARRDIFDFKSGRGDSARLARAFARGFQAGGEPLQDMVRFAQAAVPEMTVPGSLDAFGAAMADLQLRRLARWKSMLALDGRPAIDAQDFNEFSMWLALGHADLPFELVLTNQLIASVEYGWPAVHAAVRGGYTNGITTYSRDSRHGTVSVWSTYAFTGNDAALLAWREGESYDAMEAARLAGLAATHEIGHQLFHFLHPFGKPACLMSPVPMFAYRAWAQRLSARDCPVGSDPALRPGAYKFIAE